MKNIKILLMCSLLIFFFGCSIDVDNIVSKQDTLINIRKISDHHVSITMKNENETPIYFFDSLYLDNKKIPAFLLFRTCNNIIEKCNENVWVSPNFMTSSLFRPPAALSKIDPGESIVKHINILDIVKIYGGDDIENTHRVQIKLRIFFDEYFKNYKEYQSDWLPIAPNP